MPSILFSPAYDRWRIQGEDTFTVIGFILNMLLPTRYPIWKILVPLKSNPISASTKQQEIIMSYFARQGCVNMNPVSLERLAGPNVLFRPWK
jgi:hypothetical protein